MFNMLLFLLNKLIVILDMRKCLKTKDTFDKFDKYFSIYF